MDITEEAGRQEEEAGGTMFVCLGSVGRQGGTEGQREGGREGGVGGLMYKSWVKEGRGRKGEGIAREFSHGRVNG